LPARAWRRLCELAANAGLPEPAVHRHPAHGHRHRARLAVRGRARSPKIGLFQAGSHRIVDTPRCPIHHPLINEAARAIREAICETGVEPYADRPHRGALRYVQLVVERANRRVQIVLVGNGTTPEVLGELPEAVVARLGERLQGLFFNGQPERSNAILGPTMRYLAGEETIREVIQGVEVFFPPGAFGQSHLPLFDRAVARIAALVLPDRIVTELYCGVGAIGLGLLQHSREVRFNERSPDGLAGLELGLAARPRPERARARVLPGSAEERLDALEGADLVVVDPPRRGLGARLREALAAAPPERLVYLACGLDALMNDLAVLRAPGRLRLAGIEVFDFFPFTEHVETLVWLDA
jgi:23S rRNA (uracil1939-C5)-methyltransferase